MTNPFMGSPWARQEDPSERGDVVTDGDATQMLEAGDCAKIGGTTETKYLEAAALDAPDGSRTASGRLRGTDTLRFDDFGTSGQGVRAGEHVGEGEQDVLHERGRERGGIGTNERVAGGTRRYREHSDRGSELFLGA
ncbi:hypothetical protein PHYSODRAFT_347587 [Phytophthora sojae]|uniref:Uncharacterized protein n=1 Tax=Phytophthora sojae (strain P6497) TaxID=1094619 RepID=G5A1S6_PHYSP|nr:hypothetical protein PHYSODRAFT_347587 [Phytophthora sojae]EGZ10874.1 hypothetical protein PHYSODRAFT_347587 [Phytophthora sojae]|eukprot:XP_009533619.1 hypothetical protein PHYSODRAFT_347587 [Phytophthora sojae]